MSCGGGVGEAVVNLMGLMLTLLGEWIPHGLLYDTYSFCPIRVRARVEPLELAASLKSTNCHQEQSRKKITLVLEMYY